MKNQTSFYLVIGFVVLAAIGVFTQFFENPASFLKGIFLIVIIGAIVYVVVRALNESSPQKREQTAFKKAAKVSKKRYPHQHARKASPKTRDMKNIYTLRKQRNRSGSKSAPNLRVIEGKKGKKKNRASF